MCSGICIETDLKKVNELIQLQPGNRLLPFFWIIINIESFAAEESFKREMVSFYNVIFEKYGYLIDLENFFEETCLVNPNFFIRNAECDYFIPVFQKAVERFPEKLALKKSLALLLYNNQDYRGTIEILKSTHYQIQNTTELPENIRQDYFYSFDYIDSMQLLALSFEKLGDYEQVPYCLNFVFNHLDQYVEPDIFSYMDSFFLRMRINLRKGEYQKVKEDYQTIKDFLDIDAEHWIDEYGDVLNQIDKI